MPRVKTQPKRPQVFDFMPLDLHGETRAEMDSQSLCPDGQDLLGSYIYTENNGPFSQMMHNGQSNNGTGESFGSYAAGDGFLGGSVSGMHGNGTVDGLCSKKQSACRKRSAALIHAASEASVAEQGTSQGTNAVSDRIGRDGGIGNKLLKVSARLPDKTKTLPDPSLHCYF
ncbi:JM86 [macacine gammaherpesvirus 11]|uniref:JM86 n=2 Tax=macacine gammaherpesvirus 11 TaxID=2560570 RepID=G9JMR4_9GAMA|nr:JM86 [Macaca fuscata rhadinovirus]AAT00063.1 JM86 [Macaca fuscata rhadinovirus]AEW87611.1 JM86 [Macaca fuscata rhadinovirus]AEW87781.1 JM86 [Macaca fuscata rhadinovirus]